MTSIPRDTGATADTPARSREPDGTDQALIEGVVSGDPDAAEAIYNRYARRLAALAETRSSPDLTARVDTDDIVQSVFGSFFRGLGKGSYQLPPGEELWGLLAVITLNKIRAKGGYHRAAKRDVRLTRGEDGLSAKAAAARPAGDPEVLLHLSVREVLERLPDQHRVVVMLRMDGYSVEEIASMTGRSRRSVERISQECRERLSYLLEAENHG